LAIIGFYSCGTNIGKVVWRDNHGKCVGERSRLPMELLPWPGLAAYIDNGRNTKMQGAASVSGDHELYGTVVSRPRSIVVIGSLVGNMFCVNTTLAATMGIFIVALGHDYGWSRAATSLSWTSFSSVSFLGTALIGKAADRFDPGRLAAASMLAFGFALLCVPYVVQSVTALWMTYFVLAVIALGTSPVVMSRPVAAAYSRGRGFAVGVALTGVGLGNFVLPLLTTGLIGLGGWKWGYFGLGGCAIVVAPILWLTLGRGSRWAHLSAASTGSEHPGVSFKEAFQTRTFWVLSAAAVFGGFGMAGPAAHLVPVLRDQAMSAPAAAAVASLVGLAAIVGRIVTGLTLDWIDRSLPGLLFLCIGALGVMLLALFGVRFSIVAALLIGFVIGAEIDLMAYFVSRYFGLRAHAAIFGWNYGMVALGSSIAPLVVGVLRDHRGNYVLGLTSCAASLAVAGVFCALLGRYRYSADLKVRAVD
jgi:MFS family permease